MSDLRYTHTPLGNPSREIRLLRLKPGAVTDPIACTVSVVSRSANNRYIAISYTWGEATPTESIWVDGRRLEVRYNCWLVLGQMRLHNITLPIWIDSISIDQSNNTEKNEQVRHMGFIYANAYWTAACLGGGTELKTVIDDLQTYADIDTETWIINPEQRQLTDGQAQDLVRRWANLFAFASLPYFKRLWIVQELYHSKTVVAFCGRFYLSWDELESYFLAVAEKASLLENVTESLPHGYISLDEMTLARFIHFRKFRAAQSRFVASYQADEISGRGFTGILLSFGEGECQDPRDKIYALLSLARDAHWLHQFPIDYERPLTTVLLDVVLRLGEESLAENVSRLIVCMLGWFQIDPRGEQASALLRALQDGTTQALVPRTVSPDAVVPFDSVRVWRVVRAGMTTASTLPHIEDCCMFFHADSTNRAAYLIAPFSWLKVCMAGGRLVKSTAETFWIVGRAVQPGDLIVLFDAMRDERDELNTCLVCRPTTTEKHRLDIVDHATCFADLKIFDRIHKTEYAQSFGPEMISRAEKHYLRSNMLAAWEHDARLTVYLKSVDILNLVMLRGLPVEHLRHPILTSTSGCFATRDMVNPVETGSRSLTMVQEEGGNLRLNESGWTHSGAAGGHVPLTRPV